jgi:UDP-GlcNAc:undecaprenyl-phosphate GlcNAc-1-phosphate transferase
MKVMNCFEYYILVHTGCSLLVALLSSFVLACIIVPVMRKIAWHFKILDIPDGSVKKHKQPTPYLGGVAVYLVCLIPLICASFYYSQAIYLLAGCTTLVLVGLIDDLLVLSPGQKFLGQLLAVVMFLMGGWSFSNSIMGIILSALWILTIINAFNLIDVMDGLASSVAACSAFGFMFVELNSFMRHAHINLFLLLLSAVFIGAVLGFLVYNKPPATIYLGDTGSLFIGGLLGVLSFQLGLQNQGFVQYSIPVILLAIPLLEIMTLIVIRTARGIPFYKASPHHFSIILRNNGWSKKGILLYVTVMSFVTGTTAYMYAIGYFNSTLVALLGLVFLVIWFYFLSKRLSCTLPV